jgi:long-subunit fatty acid transport protein
MTIRRFFLIVPILGFLFQPASAQDVTAFDFLRIPMSARAAAMGNAFVTMKDDPSMIFFNPAGISTMEKSAASIGFVKYLLDVNAGHASYSQELQGIGHVSAGIVYMNYGDMEKTDKNARSYGTFSASDIAFSLGYGNQYKDLNYGAAVKIISSSIEEYSSSAIAVDLGAMYTLTNENIVFGVSVLNLGSQLSSYVETSEDLPFEIRFGVSHALKHLPLNIMLNFHKLNEEENRLANFSVGGEFRLSKALRARFGYNTEQRRELKIGNSSGFTGISLGFGLEIARFMVDYGYNSFGEIGTLHRFGLSTTFE